MNESQIRLEAVRFAESSHAREFSALDKPVIIDAASRFLASCYRDAGVAPSKLDGDSTREILLVHLPRRCWPKEPFIEHMVPLVRAFLAHLEEHALVPQAFESRRALDEEAARFAEAVRDVPDSERRADDGPSAPIRRPAEKVGRNDPCPCGSGRKYKQCCLKLAP